MGFRRARKVPLRKVVRYLGPGMRLTCPNCGAQYAVDPAVIPAEGRDVQCSSCGHTWFQLHPEAALAPPDEPPVEETLPRRQPDPEVMSILREEARRERAAREAAREATPLESQGELDIPEPARAAPLIPSEGRPGLQAVAASAAAAGIGALSDDERAHQPAPRRKVLPDIEEINSTLDDHEADPMPVATAARQARERQGRRLGFGLAVGFFAALGMLYVQGPRIAEAVPAFAPALDAYVAAVDGGRRWLDGALRAAVEPIEPQADGRGGGAEG